MGTVYTLLMYAIFYYIMTGCWESRSSYWIITQRNRKIDWIQNVPSSML